MGVPLVMLAAVNALGRSTREDASEVRGLGSSTTGSPYPLLAAHSGLVKDHVIPTAM
jgi:hypothetical protein